MTTRQRGSSSPLQTKRSTYTAQRYRWASRMERQTYSCSSIRHKAFSSGASIMAVQETSPHRAATSHQMATRSSSWEALTPSRTAKRTCYCSASQRHQERLHGSATMAETSTNLLLLPTYPATTSTSMYLATPGAQAGQTVHRTSLQSNCEQQTACGSGPGTWEIRAMKLLTTS